MLSASAAICAISSVAAPRSPGCAMDRALALASFTMEIGPCSPAAKIAMVTMQRGVGEGVPLVVGERGLVGHGFSWRWAVGRA